NRPKDAAAGPPRCSGFPGARSSAGSRCTAIPTGRLPGAWESTDMRLQAKVYIGLIAIGGAWAIYDAAIAWRSDDILRFLCNLAACVLVSGLKVNLPGIKGTMSVNFLFILIGVSQMTLGETLVLGCAGTLVQCFWKAKNPVRPIRLIFSVSNMAIAVTGCY